MRLSYRSACVGYILKGNVVSEIRFRDTGGHEFSITKAQASGGEKITCPECGWYGTPNDGGTEILEAVAMSVESKEEDEE